MEFLIEGMERERKRICNWDECAAKQALLIIILKYLTPCQALPLRRTFKALHLRLQSREYWLDWMPYYSAGIDHNLVRNATSAVFDCLEMTNENYHHFMLWSIFLQREIVGLLHVQLATTDASIDSKSGYLKPYDDHSTIIVLWDKLKKDTRQAALPKLRSAIVLYCLKSAILAVRRRPTIDSNIFAKCCALLFDIPDIPDCVIAEEAFLAHLREFIKTKPELHL
jgi:hypothetical protein